MGWRLRLCLRGTFRGGSLLNRFETLWWAFVLKGTKHKVYFGADSGWWEGFAEIGAAYGPFDLTMLEIGALTMLVGCDIIWGRMGRRGRLRSWVGRD